MQKKGAAKMAYADEEQITFPLPLLSLLPASEKKHCVRTMQWPPVLPVK